MKAIVYQSLVQYPHFFVILSLQSYIFKKVMAKKLDENTLLVLGKSLSKQDVKIECSSEALIEILSRNRTWKYSAYIICMMITWARGPVGVYLTVFAGNLSFKLIITYSLLRGQGVLHQDFLEIDF